MDTNKVKELMLDYLSGEMSPDKKLAFEEMIAKNPEYQEELKELSNTWENLRPMKTPEPSEKMDEKFYEMLSSHSKKSAEKSSFSLNSMIDPVITFFTQTNKQWLYRFAILIIGLGIGYSMNVKSTTNTQIAQKDAQEVRESLVLTLLEQPSASKRLQAFSETNKLEKVTTIVVEALLKTLNNDSNVNVRLAAIESLIQFADDPLVREGLVESIIHQDSPIVQVTIAKIMVALQEEGSAEELKKLLEKDDLNNSVREELEKSVKLLI